MSKRIFTVLLVFALLMLTACGSTEPEEVRYYTKEMLHTFAGGGSSRSVYEYNKDWSTRKITNYQNGEEISQVHYEMTENGYITSGTQDGVRETMEVVITKDDQGNPIRTEQYRNGELYSTSDSTYDENGNMLTYVSDIAAADMTYRMEYTYDEAGNPTKLVSENGYSTSITEYTYNEDDKLILEVVSTEGSDQTIRTEYTYSEDGLQETAMVYDGDVVSGKRIMAYDEAGNMLLREMYDSEGELMMTTFFSYVGTDGSISSGMSEQE